MSGCHVRVLVGVNANRDVEANGRALVDHLVFEEASSMWSSSL